MAKKQTPKNNGGKFRRQFRKANDKKNKNHPAYIYAKVGNEYKFIGITHAKITDGIRNIELEKNPDPQDKRPAYVRPKADKANRSIFGKRLDNWNLTDKDTQTVNKIIDENEKHKPPNKKT